MFVLILDDNLLTITSLRDQLQRVGHQTLRATAVPQTFRAAERRPDLVLINLSARTFDAPTLIQAVRIDPDLASCRVIGFCGHLDRQLQTSARQAGCDHVITNAQALGRLNETLAELGIQTTPNGQTTGLRDNGIRG